MAMKPEIQNPTQPNRSAWVMRGHIHVSLDRGACPCGRGARSSEAIYSLSSLLAHDSYSPRMQYSRPAERVKMTSGGAVIYRKIGLEVAQSHPLASLFA